MTHITESEHFDKNMIFEVPLTSNMETTRVMLSHPKILTSHTLEKTDILE